MYSPIRDRLKKVTPFFDKEPDLKLMPEEMIARLKAVKKPKEYQ